MIVGNPASRRIMLMAYNAFQRNGLSVQGTLPAFREERGNPIVRDVFWRDALRERCRVEESTAYRMVEDLARAAKETA